MLFTYTHEMNEDTAKSVAKFSRANLVRSLIAQYHALEKINQPVADRQMTSTLREMSKEIEAINTCSNPTTTMQEYLQTRIEEMRDHHQYVEIKEILDQSMTELKKESNLAKDRARYMTQNKISAIKNNAIYLGAAPTAVAVAGSILTFFSPLGWLTLGIGISMLILGELSFLLYHRTTLQQLNTKLEQGDLDSDYGSGLAIPYAELPQAPRPEPETTLLGTTSEQVVEELFDLGGDLLAGTRETVVKSATSMLHTAQGYVATGHLYSLWSTASTIARDVVKQMPTSTHTQADCLDHFHYL